MLKLIILLTIPVCLFEGLPLIRERKWKELITFVTLIGISLILSIGKTFSMLTPIELLHHWLDPLGKVVFKQFF